MVTVLAGVVAGVLAAWLMLLIALIAARPEGATMADAVKVVPDTIRLVRGLATDPTLPPSVRRTLWVLAVYLASPVDLIPDFVPVLGWADDVIVAAVALRRVVRVAGPQAIDRHWPGSPGGLAAVRRLAGASSSHGAAERSPTLGDPGLGFRASSADAASDEGR